MLTCDAQPLTVTFVTPCACLYRYYTNPSTDRLERTFWATSKMKEMARGPVRFFSYDTTHNLNWYVQGALYMLAYAHPANCPLMGSILSHRQGLYVGAFVTENAHGDSEILGYSLQVIQGSGPGTLAHHCRLQRPLRFFSSFLFPFPTSISLCLPIQKHQDDPSFSWIFSEFNHMRGEEAEPIPVMFTDQDPAMASAIRATMPSIIHLLCTWHILGKNLVSNLKAHFSGKYRKVGSHPTAVIKPRSGSHTCLDLKPPRYRLIDPPFQYGNTGCPCCRDLGDDFEKLSRFLWRVALTPAPPDEGEFVQLWACVVEYCNKYGSPATEKQKDGFTAFPDPHTDNSAIPPSNHPYLNKLFQSRHRLDVSRPFASMPVFAKLHPCLPSLN